MSLWRLMLFCIVLVERRAVVKGGGIMLRREIDNTEYPVEVGGVTPNFRVFTADGFTSESVKERTAEQYPLVIYNMVSIFNSAFVRLEPVHHMMQETDLAFGGGSNIAPIFYINSTELQRITEPSMFKGKKRGGGDPVKNAEAKWLDKFHKAERRQKEHAQGRLGGATVQRHVLQWKDLLTLSLYSNIYTFVEKLILAEDMRSAFSEEQCSTLLNKMLSENITERINAVVETYIQHNRSFQSSDGVVEISAEDNRALRLYLAQEYSVFIALAYLDTLQLIQEAFDSMDVTLSVSLSEETNVQAVLTYPVSASKDGLAEKSFGLLLTIQQLCCCCHDVLNLPPLNRPLLVVDALIPPKAEKNTRPSRALSDSPLHDSSSTSSQGSEGEEKMPVLVKETERMHSSSPIGSSITMYQPAIQDKILTSLEAYIGEGVKEAKRAYQNGVTCDVRVQHTGERSLSKRQVLNLIRLSVENVERDRTADTLVFCYNSLEWSLTTQPTESQATSVVRAGLHSRK